MRIMKKLLVLVMATLMLVGVMSIAAFGADAVDYTDAAKKLGVINIMKGDTSGNLMLDNGVTRYQAALFFVQAITGETAVEKWNEDKQSAVFGDGIGAVISDGKNISAAGAAFYNAVFNYHAHGDLVGGKKVGINSAENVVAVRGSIGDDFGHSHTAVDRVAGHNDGEHITAGLILKHEALNALVTVIRYGVFVCKVAAELGFRSVNFCSRTCCKSGDT